VWHLQRAPLKSFKPSNCLDSVVVSITNHTAAFKRPCLITIDTVILWLLLVVRKSNYFSVKKIYGTVFLFLSSSSVLICADVLWHEGGPSDTRSLSLFSQHKSCKLLPEREKHSRPLELPTGFMCVELSLFLLRSESLLFPTHICTSVKSFTSILLQRSQHVTIHTNFQRDINKKQ
jgi:hypothetical protein